MEVAIIGAGVASAGAALALDGHRPDATVTVLEQSGRIGGRAATRQRNGRTYDYGANYLKGADERVNRLITDEIDAGGLVTIDEPIYAFDQEGTISEGRPTTETMWTYSDGIAELARRLFAETPASVSLDTRIERIRRSGARWHLTDASGGEWGPFDVVLCTPPAPETAALLGDAEWESPARGRLATAAESAPYRHIWSGVLGYEIELERPYYALVNTDKRHDVGWLSREECKPGHVPDGESVLIVQANDAWSERHRERDPDESLSNLARIVADLLEDARLEEPAWTDHHYWRYAQPEHPIESDSPLADEAAGFYCLGDWVAGQARLHAALRNGLATGRQVADTG